MFINKLFKNTMIFALGNMISKLLIILLLPVLTSYYSIKEFGLIDFFNILLSLLIYIIGLNTTEYLIKEINENNEEKNIVEVTSTIFHITWMTSLVSLLFSFIFFKFGYELSIFIAVATILQVFDNLLKQIHRSIDNNFVFISAEIIYSLIFTILLLISMHFNLSYHFYFYSVIGALVCSVIYSLFSKRLFRLIKLNYFNYIIMSDAIKFSFPLMLNSIMWYIVNLGNRYFLILFLGIGASGIFAANMRLPLIIILLYSYVYKALQILIYRNNNENTKAAINIVFGILFIVVILLSIFNDLISGLLLDENYRSLSPWLPLMYLSAIFSSYSSVLGINFLVVNDSKKAFLSSAYAAIISIVGNIILIPLLGIVGTVFAMLISFLSLVVIRLVMLKIRNILLVSMNENKLIISSLLVILSLLFNTFTKYGLLLNLGILIVICITFYKDVSTLREK